MHGISGTAFRRDKLSFLFHNSYKENLVSEHSTSCQHNDGVNKENLHFDNKKKTSNFFHSVF